MEKWSHSDTGFRVMMKGEGAQTKSGQAKSVHIKFQPEPMKLVASDTGTSHINAQPILTNIPAQPITWAAELATPSISNLRKTTTQVITEPIPPPPPKQAFSTDERKQNVIEWRSSHNPFLQKRIHLPKKKMDWKQLLLSLGGAILVGAVMGFSVLNLFFSDSSKSTTTINNHLPNSSTQSEISTTKPTVTKVETTLPSLSVVMVQAGNFSQRAGAEKMVQDYHVHGLAAVMSQAVPYRIYLGMGMNRNDAMKVSTIYQQQQINVYLKELTLQGKTTALPQTQGQKLANILNSGNKLVQALGTASVHDLNPSSSATTPPFPFQLLWFQEYRQFVADAQAFAPQLPASAREPLAEMTSALDQAVQGGELASRSPNQALLLQIQEGIVRYVASYEQLIQVLK